MILSSVFKLKRQRCKAQIWCFSSIPFDYISYFSVGNFFEHDWLLTQLKTFTHFFIFFSSVFSFQEFTHSQFHVPCKCFAARPRLLIKKCDFSRIQLSLYMFSMIFHSFNSIKIVRLKGCNEIYTIGSKSVGLYFLELIFFQTYCVNFIPVS